jgi:uncharacterized protein YecE (DUF72 family)
VNDQLGLFQSPDDNGPGERKDEGALVRPAAVDAALTALAERMPHDVRLGTSSWSFPGWQGLVYRDAHREQVLARHGLAAYGAHPLLGTVGVDRTFYAPVTADVFAGYAQAVPERFRFVVKAHEALTMARYPRHARYGAQRGQANALLFDVAWARDQVVAPYVEGLGDKAGVLLFQFPPQPAEWFVGDTRGSEKTAPRWFAERLYRFLRDLPAGPSYAVEVRTPDLLTPDLAACLSAAGVSPSLAIMPGLPDVTRQAELTGALRADTLLIRWLLAPHHDYEGARAAYRPFNALVDPDLTARLSIVRLLQQSVRLEHSAFVLMNNKAEGSSPLSAFALAQALVATTGG